MAKYIRLNPLKQSLAEDLRMARSWKVLFLWIPKLFRHRLEFTSYIPVPVPFQDFVVSPESLTPQAAAQLSAPAQDAARLGFDAPVYQVMTTLAGETVMTTANCRHTGGEIVARLMHVRLGTVHPPKENLALSLISQLADGRRLVTTSQRPSFDGPPNYLVQRRIGASLEELLALHQQKLVELRPGVAPERIPDKAALAAFIDRNEEEAMQFHLRRGVYEEVSPAELAAKSTAAAVTAAVAGANETDTAVLAEIEKLRNKQGSWRAALMLAVLSFVAFIGLGRARWNWEFVLLLTGVVAFHELGHYVAMRLLHYRNVRMFFVPLLGAAVTGRHYNVKGWQRAVVSLAGPVPGILLGLLLTVIAVLTHNPLVEKTALIMLLINGINLLPFVPLDGGWVLHAV
ncbi:MAG TPA: site-2 protease family protein, partial [Bacillota bacterium]|nr:site-2 protease family protein [Bacillota bacterium]